MTRSILLTGQTHPIFFSVRILLLTINQFECNPSVADVILAWGPFLEGPGNFSSLVAPDNFLRNFSVNVREHTIASVKLPEGNFLQIKTKWLPEADYFARFPDLELTKFELFCSVFCVLHILCLVQKGNQFSDQTTVQ